MPLKKIHILLCAATFTLAQLAIAQSNSASMNFDDPQLKQIQKSIQTQNRAVTAAADDSLTTQIKKALPSFPMMRNTIHYGVHNTVSAKGEEVVTLIRNIAKQQTTPEQTKDLFQQLQTHANNGTPEAINAIGFFYDHGIFVGGKDKAKAAAYYERAAGFNYQPSLYNLALLSLYNQNGQPDYNNAKQYLAKAYSKGKDSSGRVCGMASFINLRTNNYEDAKIYADGCASILANYSRSLYDTSLDYDGKIRLLRNTFATGMKDAFPMLDALTKANLDSDNQYYYCKYKLVERHWQDKQFKNLEQEAGICVDQTINKTKKIIAKLNRDQIVAGVSSFPKMEIDQIANLRKANNTHHSWAVPYLPFGVEEMGLFEPHIIKSQRP